MTRLWPTGDPTQITLKSDGTLQSFWWDGAWHPVDEVANRWRVRTGWWTVADEAWQEYAKLVTADGLLCVLAHDLRTDTWRIMRVYD